MDSSNLYGKRKKKIPKCPNPLFSKWLTEWRDDAAGKALKSQYTYSKALSSLKRYPLRVATGKECKILENFGDKICKMLDDRLAKHIDEHGTPYPVDDQSSDDEVDNYGQLSIPAPSTTSNRANAMPVANPTRVRKNRSGGGPREYIPTPGTGPYAMITTLYRSLKNGINFMSKKDLMQEAQPHCDKSFTMPEPGTRYTAWSAMGTLNKKGLVVKASNPAKYSLTSDGINLAERLCSAEQQMSANGASSCDDRLGFGLPAGGDNRSEAVDEPVIVEEANNRLGKPPKAGGSSKRARVVPVHTLSDSDEELPAGSGFGLNTSPCRIAPVNAISDSEEDIPSGSAGGLNEMAQMADGAFHFSYVDENGGLVTEKDRAGVMIDEEISIGFLVTVNYEDLLLSGKRYKVDYSRVAAGGNVYAYLQNEDAPERSNPRSPPPVTSADDTVPKMAKRAKIKANTTKSTKSGPTTTGSTSIPSCAPTACLPSALGVTSQHTASLDDDHISTEQQSASEVEPAFTMRPGSFTVELCVDNCEVFGGGSKHSKEALLSELKKHAVPMNTRKLQVGDFLWVARERTGQRRELVLDYIVERKRMDDLAGSIIDGRFKEQKFRLKNCGLQNPCYLVEDYGSAKHLSVAEDSLNQAITNTQVVDKFYVKRTKDIKESTAYLTILTRYLQGLYGGKTLHSRGIDNLSSKNNNSLHMSEVSLMTFTEFSESSVKSKPLTVKQTFGKHLVQVGGLTADKALKILDVYPTPNSLLREYSRTSSMGCELLLKDIKLGQNRSIGVSLSKTVSLLYTAEEKLPA